MRERRTVPRLRLDVALIPIRLTFPRKLRRTKCILWSSNPVTLFVVTGIRGTPATWSPGIGIGWNNNIALNICNTSLFLFGMGARFYAYFFYFRLHAVFESRILGIQSEPSIKILRSPFFAKFWRHCVLSGGAQRHALPRHQHHTRTHSLSSLQPHACASAPRLASLF